MQAELLEDCEESFLREESIDDVSISSSSSDNFKLELFKKRLDESLIEDEKRFQRHCERLRALGVDLKHIEPENRPSLSNETKADLNKALGLILQEHDDLCEKHAELQTDSTDLEFLDTNAESPVPLQTTGPYYLSAKSKHSKSRSHTPAASFKLDEDMEKDAFLTPECTGAR